MPYRLYSGAYVSLIFKGGFRLVAIWTACLLSHNIVMDPYGLISLLYCLSRKCISMVDATSPYSLVVREDIVAEVRVGKHPVIETMPFLYGQMVKACPLLIDPSIPFNDPSHGPINVSSL